MTQINLFKVAITALLSFSLILGTALYVNPYQLFRFDLNQHNIVSFEPTETHHTISHGVNGEKAEQAYLLVQQAFGAQYVNKKVTIYVARPKWQEGQIGEDKFANIRYYGAYKRAYWIGKDTIIYDGNDFVLLHELAHFFYSHMKPHHRDEVFASMFQGLTEMQNAFKLLVQILHIVSEKYAQANQVSTPDLGY